MKTSSEQHYKIHSRLINSQRGREKLKSFSTLFSRDERHEIYRGKTVTISSDRFNSDTINYIKNEIELFKKDNPSITVSFPELIGIGSRKMDSMWINPVFYGIPGLGSHSLSYGTASENFWNTEIKNRWIIPNIGDSKVSINEEKISGARQGEKITSDEKGYLDYRKLLEDGKVVSSFDNQMLEQRLEQICYSFHMNILARIPKSSDKFPRAPFSRSMKDVLSEIEKISIAHKWNNGLLLCTDHRWMSRDSDKYPVNFDIICKFRRLKKENKQKMLSIANIINRNREVHPKIFNNTISEAVDIAWEPRDFNFVYISSGFNDFFNEMFSNHGVLFKKMPITVKENMPIDLLVMYERIKSKGDIYMRFRHNAEMTVLFNNKNSETQVLSFEYVHSNKTLLSKNLAWWQLKNRDF